MFSIDQNSHSLWDTLPKLQALATGGHDATHFVEDIDVAFTALGRQPQPLRIAPEKFHHSGGSDWGAALFYHEFLGRQPLELRRLEPQLGMKVAALARRLDTSLEELYAEHSRSDNWMLIGPSYVGDREHHRLIGDLTVAETGGFLQQTMQHAEENCRGAFPDPRSQERLREWFAAERRRVERLIAELASDTLATLYKAWLVDHLHGSVRVDLTSNLFALGRDAHQTRLLELFTRDYALSAGLYNRAVDETDVGVRRLRTSRGELPYYSIFPFEGHLVRTEVFVQDGSLVAGGRDFPLGPDGALPVEALRAGGIVALAGKAMILTMQARIGPGGSPLALPHHGSLYMPAADRLAAMFRQNNLLPGTMAPIVRVRFRLLDHLRNIDTPIRLPEHLARRFGTDEIPARQLGENYEGLIRDASARLADFTNEQNRNRWLAEAFPAETRAIEELEAKKRRIARNDPHDPAAHEIWTQVKALQSERLAGLLRQVVADAQTRELDFWDSRGAILPWSVALGGVDFYRKIIGEAEITEETCSR